MPISPVRRTERPLPFAPVQAVTPYGTYPYREGEPQLPPEPGFDWNMPYRQAAQGAMEWITACRQAQSTIRHMGQSLQANYSPDNLLEQLHALTDTMNTLHDCYWRLSAYINRDIWDKIDQAMRHSAAELVGIQWNSAFNGWTIDTETASAVIRQQPATKHPLYQQLLGSSGLLASLQLALAHANESRVIDVLRTDIPILQPYTVYYHTMQSYWPFPSSGWILNEKL